MSLPHFVVIGAATSGTDVLYRYLDQHPHIYMSPLDETNYFAYDPPKLAELNAEFPVKTLPEYDALFADAPHNSIIGDVSPIYLESPIAARRIRAEIPNAKIIAILRNPVERAYSGYLMRYHQGIEQRPPREAFADVENAPFIRTGRYYEMVKRYYAAFPPQQIRIYAYDDFAADPLHILQDIFAFIGVDATFAPDTSDHYDTSSVPKSQTIEQVLGNPQLTNVVRPFLPGWLRSLAIAIRDSNLDKTTQISPLLRKQLVQIYREDIESLQTLLNRDLSNWLTLEEW